MSFLVEQCMIRVISFVTTLHPPSADLAGTEGSRAEPSSEYLVQCSDGYRWDFANFYEDILTRIRRHEATVLYSLHHLSGLANTKRFHRTIRLVWSLLRLLACKEETNSNDKRGQPLGITRDNK
jgi:hypothetical protein